MIKIKTPDQIDIMKQSGAIASQALKRALQMVDVGVSLKDINRTVERYIDSVEGASASFKTVDDYPYATCINVNEGLVHGIPDKYLIQEGDLISIDLGVFYKGYHSDLSYTVEVSTTNETTFLETGKKALNAAIKKCKPGKRIGDISYAMQSIVEDAGYTVSEELVGHGIGEDLHEDPYVPCYGEPRSGIKLKEGMVFAVEIIYQKGKPKIVVEKDDWTISTADGSLGGLFEKTVAISKKGPILVTNF